MDESRIVLEKFKKHSELLATLTEEQVVEALKYISENADCDSSTVAEAVGA